MKQDKCGSAVRRQSFCTGWARDCACKEQNAPQSWLHPCISGHSAQFLLLHSLYSSDPSIQARAQKFLQGLHLLWLARSKVLLSIAISTTSRTAILLKAQRHLLSQARPDNGRTFSHFAQYLVCSRAQRMLGKVDRERAGWDVIRLKSQ